MRADHRPKGAIAGERGVLVPLVCYTPAGRENGQRHRRRKNRCPPPCLITLEQVRSCPVCMVHQAKHRSACSKRGPFCLWGGYGQSARIPLVFFGTFVIVAAAEIDTAQIEPAKQIVLGRRVGRWFLDCPHGLTQCGSTINTRPVNPLVDLSIEKHSQQLCLEAAKV